MKSPCRYGDTGLSRNILVFSGNSLKPPVRFLKDIGTYNSGMERQYARMERITRIWNI